MKENARSKLALSFFAPRAMQHVGFLRRHLHETARLLGAPLRSLSVAIVNDAEMSRIHDQFLGDRSTTDVITFPLVADAAGNVLQGEVVLCLDEATRSAEARAIQVQRELLLYAIHGILHLCGYDDTGAAGFRKMHAKEDELLMKMGLGRVFRVPPRRKPKTGADRPRKIRPA